MPNIQQPNVAGAFYPANPIELKNLIKQFLEIAISKDLHELPLPKAIIAPHAGYSYSGPVAASAYACLEQSAHIINQVIVLAPSHHHAFPGLAISSAHYFATPLGNISVDHETVQKALEFPFVQLEDAAFAQEHSLEVQLPFLQYLLSQFQLTPVIVGQAQPEQVAKLLETIWGGPETLIIISSDLSHYLPYSEAMATDQHTAGAILQLAPDQISPHDACGRLGIQGVLQVAEHKELQTKLVDLRNSGDMAGTRDRVVGYGAFHIGRQ